MDITDEHRREYAERGWVLLPRLLDPTELAVLDRAVEDIHRHDGPEVRREKDGTPHVIYGMHLIDERMRALSRHPELVRIARDLLGGPFYVHQSRVNSKQMGGAIVDWHQDYGTYHRVDGVPRPDGIMISVFLDDITEHNAPLMAIPGSHREGLVSEASINDQVEDHLGAARYRYDIPRSTMKRLIDRYGIESVTGPAGSVLFLNMQVVHGSTVNITPLRRVILYLNVCRTDNRGERFERPEYLAARDFSPIEPAPADCLTRFASARP
jgi:ectoine hydroxylase